MGVKRKRKNVTSNESGQRIYRVRTDHCRQTPSRQDASKQDFEKAYKIQVLVPRGHMSMFQKKASKEPDVATYVVQRCQESNSKSNSNSSSKSRNFMNYTICPRCLCKHASFQTGDPSDCNSLQQQSKLAPYSMAFPYSPPTQVQNAAWSNLGAPAEQCPAITWASSQNPPEGTLVPRSSTGAFQNQSIVPFGVAYTDQISPAPGPQFPQPPGLSITGSQQWPHSTVQVPINEQPAGSYGYYSSQPQDSFQKASTVRFSNIVDTTEYPNELATSENHQQYGRSGSSWDYEDTGNFRGPSSAYDSQSIGEQPEAPKYSAGQGNTRNQSYKQSSVIFRKSRSTTTRNCPAKCPRDSRVTQTSSSCQTHDIREGKICSAEKCPQSREPSLIEKRGRCKTLCGKESSRSAQTSDMEFSVVPQTKCRSDCTMASPEHCQNSADFFQEENHFLCFIGMCIWWTGFVAAYFAVFGSLFWFVHLNHMARASVAFCDVFLVFYIILGQHELLISYILK
ncbi:uncharacterized protein LOC101859369 [Aplysia californica]|uniref:Uncharacterized protein LOC101859369 n=1 Tax=Aplysia californica TaxID=6500 RepID=A0ABM0JAJ9_APLCA|nr:uncharacterized protein LOC101859369 [Aplysia californica]